MKIGRGYIGKYVELTWHDPRFDRVAKDRPTSKGMAALSSWKERGVIDDLTDGVVRILHSEGTEPGETEPDEIVATWVQEEIVTSIRVLVFESEASEASPSGR